MKIYIATHQVPYEFSTVLGVFSTKEKALSYLEYYFINDKACNANSWKCRFSFNSIENNDALYITYQKYFSNHPCIIYTDGNETIEIEECEFDKGL